MLDLSVLGHTTWAYRSTENIRYEYRLGKGTKNKKGEIVYKEIKGESPKEISVTWTEDQLGQHLLLKDNTATVATFSLLNDKTIVWQPLEAYEREQTRIIAIPTNRNNDLVIAETLFSFFEQWLYSKPFAQRLDQLSKELVYPPRLVKLLLLFMAYQEERSDKGQDAAKLSMMMNISLDSVVQKFKFYIEQLTGDVAYMQRLYSLDEKFILSPAKPTTPAIESIQVTHSTSDVKVVEPTPRPTNEPLPY